MRIRFPNLSIIRYLNFEFKKESFKRNNFIFILKTIENIIINQILLIHNNNNNNHDNNKLR